MKENVYYKQQTSFIGYTTESVKIHSLKFSLSFSLSLSLEIFLSRCKIIEIRRWTLCSRLFLFRLASSPRRRLFWRWTRPPPPWPWPSSPPAWVLSRRNLRRRSSSIGPRRTFWTFPNHLWEGRRSCRQICLKRIPIRECDRVSTCRSKKYSFEKERNFFSSLLLFFFACLLFFSSSWRWLLTCPFLEQKRVHTYWTVEHCDISFNLSNYISRERYYTLLLFSLFSTKGGNKRSFHGEWCFMARGMKKSFFFARAPKSNRLMEKMTCNEKRR